MGRVNFQNGKYCIWPWFSFNLLGSTAVGFLQLKGRDKLYEFKKKNRSTKQLKTETSE